MIKIATEDQFSIEILYQVKQSEHKKKIASAINFKALNINKVF